jgi:L-arabinose isomerase
MDAGLVDNPAKARAAASKFRREEVELIFLYVSTYALSSTVFSIGAKQFMSEWSKAGPAHHCPIGVGHIASKIEKLGALLKCETIRVC